MQQDLVQHVEISEPPEEAREETIKMLKNKNEFNTIFVLSNCMVVAWKIPWQLLVCPLCLKLLLQYFSSALVLLKELTQHPYSQQCQWGNPYLYQWNLLYIPFLLVQLFAPQYQDMTRKFVHRINLQMNDVSAKPILKLGPITKGNLDIWNVNIASF